MWSKCIFLETSLISFDNLSEDWEENFTLIISSYSVMLTSGKRYLYLFSVPPLIILKSNYCLSDLSMSADFVTELFECDAWSKAGKALKEQGT